MPRWVKNGGLGESARKTVENIPDGYLIAIEHGSLLYAIEKYGSSKSKMNKALTFVAMASAWEYVVQNFLIESGRTGGDA